MVQKLGYRVVLIQSLFLIPIILGWMCVSLHHAESALLGGLTFVIPNTYFVLRFFKHKFARDAKKIVGNLYWGEIIKLLMMGVIAVIFLSQLNVLMLPYITGLMGAQLGIWLTPLIVMRKHVRSNAG